MMFALVGKGANVLERLRQHVLEANLEIHRRRLALYTWGNASGVDRDQGLVVIKPSGVSYDELTAEKLVVVNLDGQRVEGDLSPSTDVLTHLEQFAVSASDDENAVAAGAGDLDVLVHVSDASPCS